MQLVNFRSLSQVLILFASVGVCLLAACSQNPGRLHQKALAAEKDAEKAHAEKDVERSYRAATRADDAASKLKELAEADAQPTEEARRRLAEAQGAARAARTHAETAEEEQQREKLLGGLKVKAYQKARTILFSSLLPQLASAAESAGRRGSNNLSAIERPLAEQGWQLASLIGAAKPLPDGSPDWMGTATQLRSWSTNQPVEFRAFVGLAFTFLGRTDFALAELEAVNVAALSSTNGLGIYHGGRTLLYAMEGWNHLASQEAEKLNTIYAVPAGDAVEGRLIVALIHGYLAYEAGSKRRFVKMDEEIAQSIRAWPENPMLVYLTGEKLAANGEWEKAAESLEASAAGTEDERIAKQLAQRARDLRDGRGSTKAFALDARFLVPFAARCLMDRAKDSTMGKDVSAAVEEANAFGRHLLERLPLIGGNGGQSVKTNDASVLPQRDEP